MLDFDVVLESADPNKLLGPELLRLPRTISEVTESSNGDIQVLSDAGLRIVVEDVPYSICNADSDTMEIHISYPIFVRLWSLQTASLHLYGKYLHNCGQTKFTPFDNKDLITLQCKHLMHIASNQRLTLDDEKIFNHYYSMFQIYPGYLGILTVFRYALAYYVLHEVAHLVYKHRNDARPSVQKREEFIADKYAYQYIISVCNVRELSNVQYYSSLIGVTNGFLLIAFATLNKWTTTKKAFNEKWHPPITSRVRRFLNYERFDFAENEHIWDYVFKVIALYSSYINQKPPTGVYVSNYAACNVWFNKYAYSGIPICNHILTPIFYIQFNVISIVSGILAIFKSRLRNNSA